MLENETAEILNKEYLKMINKKIMDKCFYFNEYPDIENCNFDKLQQLCKDKGFYIFTLDKSPIDKADCKKSWKHNKGIILYSDYSLTLIKKFDKNNMHD